jgi:hypothetical protein
MSVFNSNSLIFMLHQGKITSADVIKFFEKIVRRNPKRVNIRSARTDALIFRPA